MIVVMNWEKREAKGMYEGKKNCVVRMSEK